MMDDKWVAVLKGIKPADDCLTQSERFMQAAQELECNDNPERFKERARKVAKGSYAAPTDPKKACKQI